MFARFFNHFSQRPAMDCLKFLWSFGAGSDNDDWVPRNDVIHEDLDSFNFEHHPLFGTSSEPGTSDQESVTTMSYQESVTTMSSAVVSNVDWPCQHFFIDEPRAFFIGEPCAFFIGEPRAKRNPTEDPPPCLAPPVIQPRQVPVRAYYQIRGEWAF